MTVTRESRSGHVEQVPEVVPVYDKRSRDPYFTIETRNMKHYSLYKVAVVAEFETGRSEEQTYVLKTPETGQSI